MKGKNMVFISQTGCLDFPVPAVRLLLLGRVIHPFLHAADHAAEMITDTLNLPENTP